MCIIIAKADKRLHGSPQRFGSTNLRVFPEFIECLGYKPYGRVRINRPVRDEKSSRTGIEKSAREA